KSRSCDRRGIWSQDSSVRMSRQTGSTLSSGRPECYVIAESRTSSSYSDRKITKLRQEGHLVAGFVGSHVQANGVDTLVRAAGVLRDRGVQNIELIFRSENHEAATGGASGRRIRRFACPGKRGRHSRQGGRSAT